MKKSENFWRKLDLVRNVCVGVTLLLGAGSVRADTLQIIPAGAPAAVAGGSGVVKADKVNVRARPSTSAEVVAQLKRGDAVEILEHKRGEKGGEWLRIPLPDTAKCYVNTKYLAAGTVTADKVNVRCGPGLNHQDVGKLSKGDSVTVIKTEGDWTQIKPTAQCSGWLAAEFVEVVAKVEPLQAATPAPQPAPIVATAPVPSPATVDVIERFIVRTGILRRVADPSTAPGEYELLTPEKDGKQYRIAFVHAPQLKLDRYDGKEVRVLGTERWKRDERYPVLSPERVDPVL